MLLFAYDLVDAPEWAVNGVVALAVAGVVMLVARIARWRESNRKWALEMSKLLGEFGLTDGAKVLESYALGNLTAAYADAKHLRENLNDVERRKLHFSEIALKCATKNIEDPIFRAKLQGLIDKNTPAVPVPAPAAAA